MNDPRQTLPADLANARERFFSLLVELRPELHRYCARLTGSVVEGEDIVQDALAKAFYAASMTPELPPLRPWLFRIAHNAAIDFLKSHDRSRVDTGADLDQVPDDDRADRADPAVVRAALSRFLDLPVSQRSAVILKDVLGHSLEEAAATMGTTVPAVKAALVRGRAKLQHTSGEPGPSIRGAVANETIRGPDRARLDRYAAFFNARDWDGLRSLIGEDCRLDLVSKSTRRGREVGAYFARYEHERGLRAAPVTLEGRDALGIYEGDAPRLAYFIFLSWDGDRVTEIRDFRYARYVADEAEPT
jgi:RNA polymerase sigma-70 factor, ECF subfamily